jgi:hypothetical protein
MAGWAYLMAGIITIDGLLLGLLLMNVSWPPKRWKRVAVRRTTKPPR